MLHAGRRAVLYPKYLITLAMVVAAGGPAFAGSLVITPTFSAAVDTQFGGNASAFKSAFAIASSNFTGIFKDDIHVNIAVNAVAGTGTFGSSSTPISSIPYNNLRNAVAGDATSMDDAIATGAGGSIASTSTDPLGTTHGYWVTRAQQKALGLIADDLANDGTVTFGAGFAYDFDPGNGITAGQYDLVGVMMHEISEIMGRIGISGGLVNGTPAYTLLDLYSYKSAGTRGMLNDGGNSFSIDNGNTLLKAFNNQSGSGGDSRDWASGSNDSFNAFGSSGVLNGMTAVDVRSMDVIGYDLAAPEPGTALLGISALLVVGFIRRKSMGGR